MSRPIDLEFFAHTVVALGPIESVGDVLTGHRRIIPIIGGTVEGPHGTAEILAGGADWQIVAADGTLIIDTRYSARTDDGHLLYIATHGFRHGPPEVMQALARGESVPADAYTFRVTATLECTSPKLEWVNRTVFVGTAERQASTVVLDMYAVR